MKNFPVLYKRAKTGKIQEWYIEVEKCVSNTYASIIIKQGQLDGKKQEYIEDVNNGKNIGKSNETTPFEQACLEAESKWNKKKDEGYKTFQEVLNLAVFPMNSLSDEEFLNKYLPKDNTDSNNRPKPMLAQSYKEGKTKLNFPVNIQPKLNGVRCLAIISNGEVTLISRQGKEYKVDHIITALSNIKGEVILDGELYYHDIPLNEIVSAIKKPNKNTSKIQYWVYDIISDNSQNIRNEVRSTIISFLSSVSIIMVYHHIVNSYEDIKYFHNDYVNQGYEGAIIRIPNGKYEIGVRSKNLLKVKEFQDEEFEIIGAELGTRGTEDMVFKLKTKEGYEFKAKPKGNRDQKEEYWNDLNNLIGKMATIRYFEMTSTDNPVPFHAHLVCVRDYE